MTGMEKLMARRLRLSCREAVAFWAGLGVPPQQADILAKLYKARDFLPRAQLAANVVALRHIHVYIHHLREFLERDAIESRSDGTGWRLTDVGRQICAEILAEAS